MNEHEIKERIECLIKEMIEDGATWADERWGILGDMFEDLAGPYCVGAHHCRRHADPADALHAHTHRVSECGLFILVAKKGWSYVLAR